MKDLDQLKRETEGELRRARDRREVRQARERRDLPILDALGKMERGEPVPSTPGPRHAPQIAVVRDRCTCSRSHEDRYDHVGPCEWCGRALEP